MNRNTLTMLIVPLVAVGCARSEPSANSKSALMEEVDHLHYHIHGVDVSHGHIHHDESHTGHEHKHSHVSRDAANAESQQAEDQQAEE